MVMKPAALLAAVLALAGCASAPIASQIPTSTPASPGSPVRTAAPTPAISRTAVPSTRPTAQPTIVPATPTPAAAPTPAASAYPPGSVIVTFKVTNEKYRVLVTDPANIAIAQKLLAGKEAPRIPNGVVVRGDPSVNTGWSWHIDPDTLEFADMTTEVCDGKPSFVEANAISGNRFCPWSAKVVAIEPAN